MTNTVVRPARIVDELGELAVRMSAVLLGDDTGRSAVQLLTSLSLNAVPNASGAGVTLIDSRGARTSVAATSEAVLEADALQYYLEQGPCLDACRHVHSFSSPTCVSIVAGQLGPMLSEHSSSRR